MRGHEEDSWILKQKSPSVYEREESFPPADLSMALKQQSDHSHATVASGTWKGI